MRIITRQIERKMTTAQWTALNPILQAGEEGYDTTAKRSKIGDGLLTWNLLKWREPVVSASTPAVDPAGSVWLKPLS